ncbi:hypothetical protein ES707_16647 [subsurface metagenome]
MLGTDVIVIKAPCLVYSEFDNPLRSGGKPHLPANASFPSPNNIFHSASHLIEFHIETGKNLCGDALTLPNQTKQYMLRANIVMVEALSFLLGQAEHLARSLGKLLKSTGHIPLRNNSMS